MLLLLLGLSSALKAILSRDGRDGAWTLAKLNEVVEAAWLVALGGEANLLIDSKRRRASAVFSSDVLVGGVLVGVVDEDA